MAAAPKLDLRAAEALIVDYEDGVPVADICASYGVSASTVRATVRKAGVELRPVGRPKTVSV